MNAVGGCTYSCKLGWNSNNFSVANGLVFGTFDWGYKTSVFVNFGFLLPVENVLL